MHLTGEEILTAVAVITLAITVAAVLGGSFRSGKNTAALTAYRETAIAYQTKAEAQEGKIHDLETQNASQAMTIAELQAKMALLQDLVTGKTAIDMLVARAGEMLDQMAATRSEVREVHELLTKGKA